MTSDGLRATCNHRGRKPKPTLTVEGTVELPTPGYTYVGLHRAKNQGPDPDDLRLEVHATDHPGAPPMMASYPVRYEERSPSREYATVSIIEGPTIEVHHLR